VGRSKSVTKQTNKTKKATAAETAADPGNVVGCEKKSDSCLKEEVLLGSDGISTNGDTTMNGIGPTEPPVAVVGLSESCTMAFDGPTAIS
jgi:alkylated DNA repair dioxygenase AlkB